MNIIGPTIMKYIKEAINRTIPAAVLLLSSMRLIPEIKPTTEAIMSMIFSIKTGNPLTDFASISS
jgi:hypothetical protein